MSKKRILTLSLVALLGVTTLTGCASYTDSVWNPGNWNWSVLNPATWFNKDEPVVSEDTTPVASESDQTSGPLAKNMAVQIQRAFGEPGKQTLTVTITPSNADVNLSFSSNKAAIVVNKTGAKTAEVYATTYFAGHATITVTDSISGLTGTGKVYSIGKTILEHNSSLAHGKSGVFVISDNANPATNTGVVAIEQSAQQASDSLGPWNEYGLYNDIGWLQAKGTLYVHIAYNGSYAPKVINYSDNLAEYTKVGDVAADPGLKTAVIAVTLLAGVNNLVISGTGTGPLAAFSVQNSQAAQSIEVPDITFNE